MILVLVSIAMVIISGIFLGSDLLCEINLQFDEQEGVRSKAQGAVSIYVGMYILWCVCVCIYLF